MNILCMGYVPRVAYKEYFNDIHFFLGNQKEVAISTTHGLTIKQLESVPTQTQWF